MMRRIFFWVLLACSVRLANAQATVGLTFSDSSAFEGYTLFAPMGTNETYLIDNCGQVINQWTSAYPPALLAYLLEDGSLMRAGRIPNQQNPIGGGVVERRDWDNNLLWEFTYSSANYRQHHDIQPLPNGNVLLLARERKTYSECLALGRDPALMAANGLQFEYVIEVQPVGADSGVIVWEWHLWDHLVQDFDSTLPGFGVVADHPELLDMNAASSTAADWIHANAVTYHPGFDQVMVNSRNRNEFWIIDHSTTTAEAAGHAGGIRGKGGDILYRWGNPATYDRGTLADQQLWVQHDAHWIAPGLPGEGHILIFNNGDGRPAGNYSSIVEIVPAVDANGNYTDPGSQAYGPAAPVWEYVAPVPTDFYSFNISGSQRQANGNTLICEGANGRIFEVTNGGDRVWEYVVPLSNGVPVPQGTPASANNTFRAYRYAPDYPAFTGRDLTPGDRIELNPLPLPAECQPAATATSVLFEAMISPNPFSDELRVQSHSGTEWQLMNMRGEVIRSGTMPGKQLLLSMPDLSAGIYLLKLQKDNQMLLRKVVKQ